MRARALGLLFVLATGCSSKVAPHPPVSQLADAGSPSFVARLERDAKALDAFVTTPFAHRFLAATRELPSITPRTVYRSVDKKHWFRDRTEPNLVAVVVDDERYYEADVSAPLHYARPLDVAGARGLVLGAGTRVLDFGYGSIGHLRLLAACGVAASGIDVRPQLPVFYGEPGDVGPMPGGGSIALHHGYWPAEVRTGGDHDLFLAKNTLKKGYIHPDRPAPASMLIDLGVDDASFLRSVHTTLKPGGFALVYNLFVPIPDDQPFKPMSDGRSPFTAEQWRAAGFEVIAFDVDDTDAIQRFVKMPEIRALYTLARRAE